MKKFVVLSVFLLSFISCEMERTAEQQQTQATKEVLQQMNNSVGMPNVKNFFEKKMAKKIFELRDDSNLITYTYTINQMTGKLVYQGKSIGYGLPYSVQYTNPEYIADSMSQGGYATLPQADPNGLYMPDGLSATWILMVQEDGTTQPEYFEPEIIVSQTKKPKRLCEPWSLPSDY